ncbi:Cloroperoxidase [Trichoderma citrinoviride]|uniref:Cloroperoxidase n=1 Tax=Trichoderma citrinoviride TaxID=58853 RepID=A0A2T4B8G7_9HYPO|nr:Cloroperoxidase [Trichoderma citrinoviride]PTB65627.1 Cloroperoxidase [Trichoderma citrinoviride]
MKLLLSLTAISSLSSITSAQILSPPVFNPLDPRFNEWQAPGPNDSRGPCPGLNSLANHGFLPHSGRNITAIDILRGTYAGYHVAPDLSLAAGVAELIKAYRLAAFDLHELSNHGFISHDCSLSRGDASTPNNNDFNATIWSVPLSVLENYTIVTPQAMGAARSARDLYDIAHNPDQQCGARSIVLGALENGLLLQSLAGNPKLEWVRSLFEEQRIPTHLGYEPGSVLGNDAATVLAVGLESLVSQPDLVALLGNTVIKTPDVSLNVFVLWVVEGLLTRATGSYC